MNKKYEHREGYFYSLKFERAIKFGITTKFDERMIKYESDYPKDHFESIAAGYYSEFSKARLAEKLLVQLLEEYRIDAKHEWLDHRFTMKDMFDSYHLAMKLVRSAYAACNREEWTRLLSEEIDEMNFYRIIDQAWKDEFTPIAFRYKKDLSDKERFLYIDPKKMEQLMSDNEIENLWGDSDNGAYLGE